MFMNRKRRMKCRGWADWLWRQVSIRKVRDAWLAKQTQPEVK